MEMSVLRAQYSTLNTAHLTVDELEHELIIRRMDKLAPRASLERALRSRLKEEDSQSNVEYDFAKVNVIEELETDDRRKLQTRFSRAGYFTFYFVWKD